jgi:hypothetical protein
MCDRHGWRQEEGQQWNLSIKTFSSLVSIVVGRIDLSIRLHISTVAFINIDIVICSTSCLPSWFLLSCIVLPDLSTYNIQFVYFVLVPLSSISIIATILNLQ